MWKAPFPLKTTIKSNHGCIRLWCHDCVYPTLLFFQGYTVLALPERYKDDAVDDVELFQDTGHTRSRKLRNGKKTKSFGERRLGQCLMGYEGETRADWAQSPWGAWCWRSSRFCRSRSWFSEEPRLAVSGASGTRNSPWFSRAFHPSVDARRNRHF